MTISFTRGEYWLLEAVVDALTPVDWIAAENAAEILNKRAGHGLNSNALAGILMGLLEKGLIEFMGSGDTPVVPKRDEIVLAMTADGADCEEGLYYGLSARGGKQWEAFAQPDWHLFIDATSGSGVDIGMEQAEYICAVKERLERYFELAQRALAVVDQTSVEWDVLIPWQATYWKVLPVGHRVRFQCTGEIREFTFNPWRAMDDMKRWYAWE